MKYTSDAAQLCATHYSNDRPAPQDALTEKELRYRIQESLEKIQAQREAGIERAYNREIVKIENHSDAARMCLDMVIAFSGLEEHYKNAKNKDSLTWGAGRSSGLAFAYDYAKNEAARLLDTILQGGAA